MCLKDRKQSFRRVTKNIFFTNFPAKFSGQSDVTVLNVLARDSTMSRRLRSHDVTSWCHVTKRRIRDVTVASDQTGRDVRSRDDNFPAEFSWKSDFTVSNRGVTHPEDV